MHVRCSTYCCCSTLRCADETLEISVRFLYSGAVLKTIQNGVADGRTDGRTDGSSTIASDERNPLRTVGTNYLEIESCVGIYTYGAVQQ